MAKWRIYGVNSNISPKEVLIKKILTAVGGDVVSASIRQTK